MLFSKNCLNKTLLIISILLIMFVSFLLTSCSDLFGSAEKEPETYTCSLSCFPENEPSYKLKAVLYRVNRGEYEVTGEFDMGTVTADSEINQTVSVKENDIRIEFILSSEVTNAKLFISRHDINSITDKTVTEKYWLYYDYYTNSDTKVYGYSKKYVQPIPAGTSFTIDYNIEPFYIYEIDNVKGKTFKCRLTNTEGYSTGYFSSSYSVISFDSSYYGSYSSISAVDSEYSFTDDIVYLFLEPDTFSSSVKSEFFIEDITQQKLKEESSKFEYRNAFYANKNLYFDAASDSRRLVKWDLATELTTVMTTFTSDITDSVQDGDIIYLGVGKQLYKFDAVTEKSELLYNFPSSIDALHTFGDYLLVDSLSSVFLFTKATSTAALVNDTLYSSLSEGIYFPAINRSFFIDTSYASDSIYFFDFDTTPDDGITHTFSSSFVRNGSFLSFIKQYKTEQAFITGNGNIYKIDESDAANKSKLLYSDTLGVYIEDILFYTDYYLTLEDTNTGTVLVCHNTTAPFAEKLKLTEYTSESGLKLIPLENSVLVITSKYTNYSTHIQVRNIPLTSLQPVSNSAAVPSGSR